MPKTTFAVRQFFTIPPGELPLGEIPTGTFIVTGSQSNILINNTRTDLANDSIAEIQASSGTSNGWWPGSTTFGTDPPEAGDILQGIIAGGNVSFENSSPDGRTSYVSCWGFAITASAELGTNQPDLDIEFRALAGTILGDTFADTASAKASLRNAGYYFQYPMAFVGQSKNTGTGSDV